jgi:glutamate-1-semialdehyde aminotransferase
VAGEAVTDFVGGFGAALLGHNPPELKQLATPPDSFTYRLSELE